VVTKNSKLILYLGLYCEEWIAVAVRSKARVCGCSLAGIAGSNSSGARLSLSCECGVLPGRGLCDGPITRPEESYRAWCV
jgi:hypothetical protein